MAKQTRIVVIGAGIGGLTTAALLAQAGHDVTVLEAQSYPGGSAGTFPHQGYRFDAGATVAGGLQPGGPHALIAERLGLSWPVRAHDPAWVVHLPDHDIALSRDNADVLAHFPHSARFWDEQSALADLCWRMSAAGLPWPPTDARELRRLASTALRHFPADLRLLPFTIVTAHDWLRLRGLAHDPAFTRFIDAQLLIAAQTTSRGANAVYSATALDLARQGVYHVEGGIGGLAETLVAAVEAFGGRVLTKRRAVDIVVEDGRAVAVMAERRRQRETFPADFVVGNLTPWSLDALLGDDSPRGLRREVARRRHGWGAFVLHVGVRDDHLPAELTDHHQVIEAYDGAFGEGRSAFVSLSPHWDGSRAPVGHRAATITTHTAVAPWWAALAESDAAYAERKAIYGERMLALVERAIPGFRASIALALPGTPVTYNFYTGRHLGMVGGFPQGSLLAARSPRTGLPNVRLVGDSIFPGQSTAGVTLGAIRVADDVLARVGRLEAQAYRERAHERAIQSDDAEAVSA
ncbi:MAG: FAD-dependent oxidoreductase [Anaerolineae bacterium]|nr:FAD-dependent oxidoreductase [Anaerolineae bacterium]